MKNLLFFVALIFGLVIKTATAGTVVLDAIDSGHYNRYGIHWASIKSYEAYSCGKSGFLVFNIPSTSNITSAKLRLSVGSTSHVGVAGVSRVDPSISIDQLRATHSSSTPYNERVAIYRGLHTGELGRASPSSSEIDIPLNSNGIAILNSASGQIAFGTYIIHATTGVCGKVFGGTGEHSTRQLILETEDAPTPTVTVTSPNTSATYQPGNEITLEWTTTNADAGDNMVLSMKRDMASGMDEPDGINWFRFTENTPNDGSEPVTIPSGLSAANDWRFFVRHAVSDVFDASDELFIYDISAQLHALTTTKSGTGNGVVNGDPAGINCGTDCTEDYDDGTVVTLSAIADAGSVFTGWSHPDCSGTDSCQVTIDADKEVTANFDAVVQQVALTVTKSGNGTGTVTSSPEHGINCGDNCQVSYPADPIQTVSLQVEADPGFVFNGWSGACNDTNPVCDVVMDGDKTVSAQFIAAPVYSLTVGIEPAGSGSVSDGSQINCPATSCTGNYDDGLEVTLTAEITNPEYLFKEWQGCTPKPSEWAQCTVGMTNEKNVTAIFEPALPPPTVEKIIFNLTTDPTNFLKVRLTCKAKDEHFVDRYTWDFGDGATGESSESIINHTYAQEGTYNVSCTAIDSFDGSGSLTSELLLLDSDGDSLPDLWEMEGIDINDDGNPDLILEGADPNLKDIYIEIDYMHGHRPLDKAIKDVVKAFHEAPVGAGEPGPINLHYFIDEEIPEVAPIIFDAETSQDGNHYLDLRGDSTFPAQICGSNSIAHFGRPEDREDNNNNCENSIAARHLVFRYVIFGHSYKRNPDSSGVAFNDTNIFFVSLGHFTDRQIKAAGGKRVAEAGAFMHELGHTLGLHHGGGDIINCKPNYVSVMSYSLQFKDFHADRKLDYSRHRLDGLFEEGLLESDGIKWSDHDNLLYPYGVPSSVLLRKTLFGYLNQPVDWNNNGSIETELVDANINSLSNGCDGEGRHLVGYDDWRNLNFNFQARLLNAGGATIDEETLTGSDVVHAAETTDFDKDGYVNLDDNCPAIHNPNQLDSDNDGVGDLCESDLNQCDITYDLPSNQWRQVSLPCDPGANNTVADVFGDDNLGTNYTTDWVLYRYDTEADNYIRLTMNEPLIQGVGYWIIQTTNDNQTLDMPDDSTPTPITHPTACAPANGCFEISLDTQATQVQWNMIGNPFASTQSLGDDTKVVTSTGDCISGCTLSDAEVLKIVHNEFWTYNGANYTKIGTGGQFVPWMGYWSATLKSANDTLPTLLVPKP